MTDNQTHELPIVTRLRNQNHIMQGDGLKAVLDTTRGAADLIAEMAEALRRIAHDATSPREMVEIATAVLAKAGAA